MAFAIVLAAGSGSRMKADIPKQFLMLDNKEVIYYSLKTFQENENITDIILVTGKEYIDFCKKEIVKKYGISKVSAVIPGGAERYDSVYQGLLECQRIYNEETKTKKSSNQEPSVNEKMEDIVLIHDGARPFMTDDMINESVECIENGYTGCTVAVPAKDTVKIIEKKEELLIGKETPVRSNVYLVQTPQTFKMSKLIEAYDKMYKEEHHNITDDTMIMEQYIGEHIILLEGIYENIKLTTPEDLLMAEIYVKKNYKKM